MKCENAKELLMGLLDNELSSEDREAVLSHLNICENCRKEQIKFKEMDSMMQSIQFIEPSDKIWDGYWNNIYNRIERGFAWLFISLGSLITLSYLGYNALLHFFQDPEISVVIKSGSALFGCGVIILIVSVIRERFTLKKHDKYERIQL